MTRRAPAEDYDLSPYRKDSRRARRAAIYLPYRQDSSRARDSLCTKYRGEGRDSLCMKYRGEGGGDLPKLIIEECPSEEGLYSIGYINIPPGTRVLGSFPLSASRGAGVLTPNSPPCLQNQHQNGAGPGDPPRTWNPSPQNQGWQGNLARSRKTSPTALTSTVLPKSIGVARHPRQATPGPPDTLGRRPSFLNHALLGLYAHVYV